MRKYIHIINTDRTKILRTNGWLYRLKFFVILRFFHYIPNGQFIEGGLRIFLVMITNFIILNLFWRIIVTLMDESSVEGRSSFWIKQDLVFMAKKKKRFFKRTRRIFKIFTH